jgi:NAD(P)-dependent dehydrogenase (short-subunit alcohol dehydrogenase family)
MLLPNRVSIVTGGAKGIGKGIALEFAEQGSSIIIADVLEKEANQTVKEISRKGIDAIFIKCDHTDSHQVKKMTEGAISKFGKIDILVNNAGGFGKQTPVTDLGEDDWDRTIALNLKGVFLCSKEVVPHMIKRRYGRIINMSSIAAISAGPPSPHYSASKGGILSFTLDLALELARFNITVNAILPGTIRTDMWKSNIPPGDDEDSFFQQMAKTHVPLQRIGTPEDVAGAALFFASNLSSYVTGDRIIVAGGLPLQVPPF